MGARSPRSARLLARLRRRRSSVWATATNNARAAIDNAVAEHDLDSIVAPTNNAAWLTDLENGDELSDFVSSSSPAAISRHLNTTFPAGLDPADLQRSVDV